MKDFDRISEEYIERLTHYTLSRRGFLRFMGTGLAFLLSQGVRSRHALAKTGITLQPRPKRAVATDSQLGVARGEDPAAITRAAVEALGGMGRFVRKGDTVVVKPNIAWDRTPEQAATTNPAVVAAIVRMCLESGAKIVKVFDNTCNDARRTYLNSGIYDAVRKAGGTMYYVSDWKFYPGQFPQGSLMNEQVLFRDAVECDCLINVPVAKVHRLTNLSLSMKNLMGICRDRGYIHRNIDQKLTELLAFMKPDLTVIDAYRILTANGPTGGNLKDVQKKNTVIASADPVLADAYAATLFGRQPGDIGALRLAAQAKLGSMDIAKARIKEVKI